MDLQFPTGLGLRLGYLFRDVAGNERRVSPTVSRAREPEFKAQAERFRDDMTDAALVQISAAVPDQAWARWAAQLAPAVAIEAIIAWLDAGQPDPAIAAGRVRHVVAGVITAAVAQSGLDCLPGHQPECGRLR